MEKFFGSPLTIDMKLTDISKSLSDINTRLRVIRKQRSFSDLIAGLQTNIAGIVKILDDISNGIPNIVARTSLIKISAGVAAADIIYISYVVSAGSAPWSQQNNTIKYTAAVNGIYRLSVFRAAKLNIFTTNPWRHSTDRYSRVVSVVLNSGTEETFILDPTDKTLTATTYWWYLEFVTETSQLVTV